MLYGDPEKEGIAVDVLMPNVFLVRSPVFELLSSMFRLQSHEMLSQEPAIPSLVDFDLDLFVDRVRGTLPESVRKGLEVYFNAESYLGMSLVRYAWVNNAWESVEAFLERLSSTTPEELFRTFLDTGYTPGGPLNVGDPHSVRDYIHRTNLPDVEKWKLAHLYLNAERTLVQLMDLIDQCHRLYFEAEWERLHRLQQDSAAQVAAKIYQRRDLRAVFPFLEGVPIDKPEATLVVCPSVFYHLDTLSSFDDERLLYLILYGIQYPGRASVRPDAISAFLKVLADETRVKIIKTLAVGPGFGYELAQRLNLSNSTISHHLGQLADLGLVVPERHENRVYYALERRQLQTLLAALQRELLG